MRAGPNESDEVLKLKKMQQGGFVKNILLIIYGPIIKHKDGREDPICTQQLLLTNMVTIK